VVSDTPIRIYDPTRENVLAHEFVNETVMREYTVIPMSFGTLFRTEEDIVELLKSTYQAFDDVLEKMKDKIEFGLKVLWDREKVIATIEEENEEIRRLKDEINRNAQSSTYFARMQLGRLVEAALEEAGQQLRARHPRGAQARRRRLALQQADRRPDDPERRLPGGPRPRRLRRGGQGGLAPKYEALLTFKYTGPWPPYNFVNIKLKLEKATIRPWGIARAVHRYLKPARRWDSSSTSCSGPSPARSSWSASPWRRSPTSRASSSPTTRR
jgi:hypothetical protein